MKTLLSLLIIISATIVSHAQLDYKSEKLNPIPRSEVIDVNNLGPDFRPDMSYMEGPKQSSTKLEQIKEEMSKKYPKQYNIETPRKRLADPPEMIIGFDSNSPDGSIPEDNHIAVSNNGEILSVVNSNVSMREADGSLIRNRALENFTGSLAEGRFKFDPRTMYDPVSDRFVFVCLAGNNSQTSEIIIGFSQTNEVNSTWNLYEITGNPRQDDTWSDYPMISLTNNELFLTLNMIQDGVSWQEGFTETFIYQIDKNNGYEGEELSIRQWSDITWDGISIRNLCPIKYADENLGDNQYFLSSLNFSIETDTIFIAEITDQQDDAELIIDVRNADFSYGAPPVANQPQGLLQTNDARILDGFFINDHIQFVGNTINYNTGFADVYHGIIENISGDKDIRGTLIGGSNVEYGYPGIAWTGTAVEDRECIIAASHSAIDKNPGISAFYFDNAEEYSAPIEIKEGLSHIDDLNGTDERWGDYMGCQRQYNEPGVIWISGSYGAINNRSLSYASQISKPNRVSSTEDIVTKQTLIVAPNPTFNKSKISFEVFNNDPINIQLLDMNGQLVKLLYDDRPKKIGLIEFSFSTDALDSGTYILNTRIGGKEFLTEKIIVTM